MTKVYCIINSSGSYDDYHESIEKAFFDKSEAKEYMDARNDWLKSQIEMEKQKIKILNEADIEDMTEDEWDIFQAKYDPDYYILYDQHRFRMNIIEVE